MKPVTAGVRVPVTITTDATQLAPGLARAKAALQGIGQRMGSSLMGSVGGMLSGWLGIQGAMRGLQAIREEAERLQGLARKWDIGTIKEHAKTQVMQMQAEQAVAKGIGPAAQMEEQRLQGVAAVDASQLGIQQSAMVSSLGSQSSDAWQGFKDWMSGVAMTVGGDSEAGGKLMDVGTMRARRGLGLEDNAFFDALDFTGAANAASERGREVERQALEAIARASRETSRNTRGNT